MERACVEGHSLGEVATRLRQSEQAEAMHALQQAGCAMLAPTLGLQAEAAARFKAGPGRQAWLGRI